MRDLDLLHCLGYLSQANVEVELFLLQRGPLFVVQAHEMLDKVKEVSRSDCHDPLSSPDGSVIDLVQSLVYVHHGRDDRLTVRRHLDLRIVHKLWKVRNLEEEN